MGALLDAVLGSLTGFAAIMSVTCALKGLHARRMQQAKQQGKRRVRR